MPTLGWILVIIIALVALVVGIGIGCYNRLVRLRNTLQESWRQVDVELNRRYDLIPNLVESVKGYAQHERGTLDEIVRLRNQASSAAQLPASTGTSDAGASPERAQAEAALSQQISRLLVTVEAYPQLQANQNFVELQRQLADTEDRIAAGRRFYNANVRAYNTAIESVPTSFVASAGHFEKAAYFEVTDQQARQAPAISFGTDQPATPSAQPGTPGAPTVQWGPTAGGVQPGGPYPQGGQFPSGQQGGQYPSGPQGGQFPSGEQGGQYPSGQQGGQYPN